MFDDVLDEWVRTEMRPWLGGTADRAGLTDALIDAMAEDHAIIVLQVHDGQVSIDPRSVLFDDPTNIHFAALAIRGYFYRDFFQAVVSEYHVCGSATIGVFVQDGNPRREDLPLLCFQKEEGLRSILVPDVDFMANNFYADDGDFFTDNVPFEAKANKAIFVGSSTGTPCLTMADIVGMKNDRIRAAVFFKDQDRVSFSLPNIVQVDTKETYDAIIALDFERHHATWQQQLAYRYLLSMDGNGATCSRMVISLLSNSVLLKYRSSSRLFYFHGLQAGIHYIPIEQDKDVLDILAHADTEAAAHRKVAEAGRAFAEVYLSRRGIMAYTAKLLAHYIGVFGFPPGDSCSDDTEPMDSFVHVQGIGTTWTSRGEWSGLPNRAIEGFAIMPNNAMASGAYEYAAVTHQEGERTAFVQGGRYCGSRGRSAVLHGICLRSTAGERTSFRYRCRFLDGYISQWHGAGSWVERVAPLVGFQVQLHAG